MKTVITSTSDKLASEMDPRFGRAKWFCIYDHQTENVEFIKNGNMDAHSGAGTKNAELMAEINATQVVSGDFGPKAKTLLEKLRIQMIIPEKQNTTIEEILEKIKNAGE